MGRNRLPTKRPRLPFLLIDARPLERILLGSCLALVAVQEQPRLARVSGKLHATFSAPREQARVAR